MLSSPSSVLLCNLTLQAGESKTGERNYYQLNKFFNREMRAHFCDISL